MTREVHLNDIDPVLDELDYPIGPDAAATALSDVRLVYADGGEDLAAVLDRLHDDRFETPDDLRASVFAALPTEAVGEPGQSEGEG